MSWLQIKICVILLHIFAEYCNFIDSNAIIVPHTILFKQTAFKQSKEKAFQVAVSDALFRHSIQRINT